MKVRFEDLFFENKEVFYLIVLLKHATVRAKKPWLENSKIATRWDNIYKRMIEEKAPLDIKDLAVTGGYIKEHLQCVRDAEISQLMLYLQRRAVVNVKLNNKESLTNLALKWIKKFRTIVRR
ncbi:MAG: hypothetical protein RR334_01680 [Clostridia bacterium]